MSRRNLVVLAKAGLSVMLVGYLVGPSGLARIIDGFARFGYMSFSGIVLLLFLYHIVSAGRWLMILRVLGCAASLPEVTRQTFVAAFFNQFLPTSVGSDVMRVFEANRSGHRLSQAINSVILDRALYLLVLIVFAAIGLTLWPGTLPAGVRAGTWALCLPALCGAFLLPFLPRIWQRIFLKLPPRFTSASIAAFVADCGAVMREPRAVIAAVASVAANQLALAAAVYVISVCLETPFQPTDCLALLPLVTLAATLPISLAGWGVREAAMASTFGYAGVAPEAAIAVSVFLALFSLVAALPGAPLWLLRPSPQSHAMSPKER